MRAAKKALAVLSSSFAIAALVSVSASSTNASETTTAARHSTMLASAGDRARMCEQSNDAGENGAKTCFVDRGDNWFACDIDEGGSGIAWVRAWEGPTRHGPWHRRGTELDDNVGSDGCDEGPGFNLNEGNVIRLKVCILTNGNKRGCDVLKVRE